MAAALYFTLLTTTSKQNSTSLGSKTEVTMSKGNASLKATVVARDAVLFAEFLVR